MEEYKQVDATSPKLLSPVGSGDHHQSLQSHFFSFASKAVKNIWASVTVFIFFFIGAFFFRINVSVIRENFLISTKGAIEYPLKCPDKGSPIKCEANNNYPAAFEPNESWDDAAACPEYFRWIHEDLRPWKSRGISRDTLERAKSNAAFRLVIINGKIYLEKYRSCFQTRELFTTWGIMQLLRLYPGRIPDLELMFQCGDMPRIEKVDFEVEGPNATLLPPPPLFQYCGHDAAYSIIFPEWSFWGWPEVNIKPWKNMIQGIIKGSKKKKWKDRIPYAFWKGNAYLTTDRINLMTCTKGDGNARIYFQDWGKAIKTGYKNSHLEDQCDHRYKIYIEGRAWSVSDKYILACDSMTLLIKPDFYDFFLRSIEPLQHYWPIRKTNKCEDIKFAVEWGNNHTDEAEAIGKRGSKFIKEDLKMEYIYGYMFHLLSEYARLLKFKPEIPKEGVEICVESMACNEKGLVRNFVESSMVMSPSNRVPCEMPPPYDPSVLHQFLRRKENISRQVVMWENEYRQILKNKSGS